MSRIISQAFLQIEIADKGSTQGSAVPLRVKPTSQLKLGLVFAFAVGVHFNLRTAVDRLGN